MKTIRPLLFLGALSLLITWLLWPDQNQPDSPPHGESGDFLTEKIAPATLAKRENQTPAREIQAVAPQQDEPDILIPQTPKNPEDEFGEISVRILDHFENLVLHGKVLVLQRGRVIQTLELDPKDRRFHCRLAAKEDYQVMVKPDSLQAGLVPQLVRSRTTANPQFPRDKNDLKNFAQVFVRLQANEIVAVDLVVGSPAHAFGRVLGPHGAAVEGVLVTLSGLDRNAAGLTESSVTNQQGIFSFAEVFPGNHRLLMHLDPTKTPDGETWSPPSPWDVEIAAGQIMDFGDTFLGGGNCSISGWIVNQDGNPFADLPVLCFSNREVKKGLNPHTFVSQLGRATTNAEGFFEIKGLEPGPIKISVTPDYNPRSVLGLGHPAMWEPNIELDFEQDGPQIVLTKIVVDESRPFILAGNLIYDDAWLAAAEHQKDDLRIFISPVKGEELAQGVRRNVVRKLRVRPDWEASTYAALVETPMPLLEIHFQLKDHPELSFRVLPEALQSWAQDIHIPSDFDS